MIKLGRKLAKLSARGAVVIRGVSLSKRATILIIQINAVFFYFPVLGSGRAIVSVVPEALGAVPGSDSTPDRAIISLQAMVYLHVAAAGVYYSVMLSINILTRVRRYTRHRARFMSRLVHLGFSVIALHWRSASFLLFEAGCRSKSRHLEASGESVISDGVLGFIDIQSV